jgi:hypothetical protein
MTQEKEIPRAEAEKSMVSSLQELNGALQTNKVLVQTGFI